MERHDLWRVPQDLQAMGWQWIAIASTEAHEQGSTWYTAVYARPFEPYIDAATSRYHHPGDRWVWVSTHGRKNASWADAHRNAIGLMRDADARRTSG